MRTFLGALAAAVVGLLLFVGSASAENPVLLSPSDGAVVPTHTLQPDGSYSFTGSPVLSYTCPRSNFGGYSSSWLFYHVQIADDPSQFTNATDNDASPTSAGSDTCTATPYSWTGIPHPGTYYWRIIAESSSLSTGGTYTSAIGSFTVALSPEISPSSISPPNFSSITLPQGETQAPIGSIVMSFHCPRYSTHLGSFVNSNSYSVEMASSPAADSNGFPASGNKLFYALGNAESSGGDECVIKNTSPLPTGTYYWEPHALDCSGMFLDCQNAGEVWSFTVAKSDTQDPGEPPPPASPSTFMSKQNADVYARKMVFKRTPFASRIKTRCSRTTSSSFYCSPKFKVGPRTYIGGLVVTHVVQGGTVYWSGKWRRYFRLSYKLNSHG